MFVRSPWPLLAPARARARDRSVFSGGVDVTVAVSEAELQRTVTEALGLFGWRWTHFRPARTTRGWRTPLSGCEGFPDVVAVRVGRVVALELKAERGRLSDGQAAWLAEFALAGVEARVVRPSDWAEVAELLR